MKSLKEIGFDQYYQAEQTGWVLYLEGSTDLAILQRFAHRLGHEARKLLARPFVHYVLNLPNKARDHFYGLREAREDLVGFALFDRIDQDLQERSELREYKWKKREIENYLCMPEALLAYAEGTAPSATPGPLFESAERERRRQLMQECIEDFVPRAALRDTSDRWWSDTKASDDFLDRLFETFFKRLNLPNLMRKTDYHALAACVPDKAIDPEVSQVLDLMLEVARKARPAENEDGA